MVIGLTGSAPLNHCSVGRGFPSTSHEIVSLSAACFIVGLVTNLGGLFMATPECVYSPLVQFIQTELGKERTPKEQLIM